MKILRRVLIILTVFSILTGLMVITVNTVGDLVGTNGRTSQSRPDDGGDGFSAEGNENRPERDDGDQNFSVSRMLSGVIQNMVVIGFLVTVIVWPKSVVKKKKKTAAVITASGKL